jgi:hypothetical protein
MDSKIQFRDLGRERDRRFADSPLEGGVSCELVSEIKI